MIEHDLTINGLSFRMKADVRRALAAALKKKALKVDLRREPDNEYDANAIMVFGVGGTFDERHLGYVARESAEVLAPRLDAGTLVIETAKLTELWGPEFKMGNANVRMRFRPI